MKKCKIIIKHGRGKREVTGDFYGFFQISQIGGVFADVVAVVDVGQGPRKFYIEDITKLYEGQEEETNKKAIEEGMVSFVYDLEKDEIKKKCCENCEKCKEKKAVEEGIARLHCIINKEGLLERCEELQ